MKNPIKEKISFPVFLSSCLVAFYFDIKVINWTLVYGGIYENGLMNSLYPVTIMALLLLGCHNFSRYSFRTQSVGWLLTLYLLFFFYYSNHFIGPSHTTTSMFLGFTIAGFVIPLISKVDVCLTLKAIMLFPSIAIFKLNQVFELYLGSISMDASYGFIVPITACFIYFFTYFKQETGFQKYFTIVLLGINGVFLGYLVMYGSRGPLFGLVCLMAFIYFVKFKGDIGVSIDRTKRRMIIAYSIIGLIFLAPAVSFLNDILSSNGVHIYAIEKMDILASEGDITNGRSGLLAIAFNGFLSSPLWGLGFDRFNAHTNLLYPHNFIMQILYDGGLFLFCILILPLLKMAKIKYTQCTKNQYIITTFLIFASVPGALFSQNLWMNGPLWMCFGFLMSNSFIYKRNEL